MKNENIVLARLRTSDNIVSDAIKYISHNFLKLFGPLVRIVIPLLLILAITEAYLSREYFSGKSDVLETFMNIPYYTIIGSFISYFIISLFVFSTLSLFHAGAVITPLKIFNTAKEIGLRFLGLVVLFVIGFMLSVFLLFLPLPFLYVLFSVSVADIIFQKSSVLGAIKNARHYLKGFYWKTIWLTIGLSVIQFFAAFIFSVPSFIYEMFNTFHSLNKSAGMQELFLNQFFELLNRFSYLLSIVFWVGIFMQYFNLREIKKGDVLMQDIERQFGNKE